MAITQLEASLATMAAERQRLRMMLIITSCLWLCLIGVFFVPCDPLAATFFVLVCLVDLQMPLQSPHLHFSFSLYLVYQPEVGYKVESILKALETFPKTPYQVLGLS
ncbi:hypothetical protein Tco_1542141 [Tanacetum coccineum]